MSDTRRFIFFVYDGFSLMDTSGTAGVLSTANLLSRKKLYETLLVSTSGGHVCSESGITVDTIPASSVRVGKNDTVLVAGAERRALRLAIKRQLFNDWLQGAAKRAERYGSVCTGAFLLASAGLLNGKHATTHWLAEPEMVRYYPEVKAGSDTLYQVDGNVWTSAGATSGIDMALAMIRDDHGAKLMADVAKRLVLYTHRPGNQSQFSAILDVQTAADAEADFSEVVQWAEENLQNPIKVEDLAAQAGMSERTFYRRFTKATGITPARLIENLRFERAKTLLEVGTAVKKVARAVGFSSEGGFRHAFEAKFGITPSVHRLMHGTGPRKDSRPVQEP